MSQAELRVVLLILGFLVTDSTLGDPCVNHTVLDQPWRSTNCSHTECIDGQWMSDRNLAVGWYRFNSSGGWKIPETVVPRYHCSGEKPGWLNGPHPNVGEGEVTRTVCFTHAQTSCHWSLEIRVKNCSGYFVYWLWPAPVGNAVFCTEPLSDTTQERQGSVTGEPGPGLTTSPAGSLSSGTDSQSDTTWETQETTTGEPGLGLTTSPAGSLSSVTDSTLGDPCVTHTVLDQPWRSTDCSHTECTDGRWMSDGHLEVGWYRFISSGGWKIPETVVPQYRCSGEYPGWLNGLHPNVGEGEVTRTVCFTVGENTCYWRREIGLKNCSGYFVYRLGPTPVGTTVYCTGLEFSTLEQSTGLTTTEHIQELSSVPAGDTSSDLEASTMDQSNGSSTGQPTATPSSTSAGERSSGVRVWINVQLTSSGNVSEDEVWKAIRRKLQEMFGDPNLQIKLARFRAEPSEK